MTKYTLEKIYYLNAPDPACHPTVVLNHSYVHWMNCCSPCETLFNRLMSRWDECKTKIFSICKNKCKALPISKDLTDVVVCTFLCLSLGVTPVYWADHRWFLQVLRFPSLSLSGSVYVCICVYVFRRCSWCVGAPVSMSSVLSPGDGSDIYSVCAFIIIIEIKSWRYTQSYT